VYTGDSGVVAFGDMVQWISVYNPLTALIPGPSAATKQYGWLGLVGAASNCHSRKPVS
jgi:hypothetical protein